MLPAQFVNQLVSGLAGEGAPTRVQNDDLAFHLSTTPAARRPLWSRLLPATLRRKLADRAAQRRHEQDLIALWEMSPHLLKDIGVYLPDADDLPDDMVAAPARVVEHVNARIAEQQAEAAVAVPSTAAQPARERPATGQTAPVPYTVALPSAA